MRLSEKEKQQLEMYREALADLYLTSKYGYENFKPNNYADENISLIPDELLRLSVLIGADGQYNDMWLKVIKKEAGERYFETYESASEYATIEPHIIKKSLKDKDILEMNDLRIEFIDAINTPVRSKNVFIRLSNIVTVGRFLEKQTGKKYIIKSGYRPYTGTHHKFRIIKGRRVYMSDEQFFKDYEETENE